MSKKQKQPETCIMINDTSQHHNVLEQYDFDVVGCLAINFFLQIYC